MGGSEYQAACLVDELVKNGGFEIFYLSRVVDPSFDPKGYRIIRISGTVHRRYRSFAFDALPLTRLLREIRPDVIYQRALQPYTGIAAHYARRNDCKFVFHVASDYDVLPARLVRLSPGAIFGFMEKKVGDYGLIRAHHVIAQSKYQSDLLKANYGKRTAEIVPNFHPLPKEELRKKLNPLKVVWVGNFKRVKRPEIFVRLAEELRGYKEVEFIMVGRPGDARLYGKLHQRIAETMNLRYIGEQPIEKVNQLLAEASIFINTSTAEGFPNTFIQAWMRRVPVVSLSVDVDGVLMKESIGFCDGTYSGLINAAKKLVESKDLRCAMGRRAQTHAFEHHSTRNVGKLISFFRD